MFAKLSKQKQYTKVEISKNCKYNIQRDGVWTTREGLRIWVPELEDSHLKNIWNIIKDIQIPLNTAELRFEAESVLQGDAALDSIAEQFDENGMSMDEEEDDVFATHPQYDHIKKEMKKRGF
tara:strand:+ start:27 stop:392 length:366 start_codon:yes stop_codon:yes gene_type:complete